MTTAIDQHRLAEAIAWLIDGCRSAPTADAALNEICERLVASGVPLANGAIFVRALHPEIMARRFFWQPVAGAESVDVGYDLFDDPLYRDSPVKHVFDTGVPLRRAIGRADCPIDFTFLDQFRADGFTDFLALPLLCSDGAIHACAWMSRAPGGFDDAAIAALHAIEKPMARMVEVRNLKQTAINLLDTYVGGQAGARILGGGIRRGNVESIRAAIWLSDMRGFTARADRMPATDLVALLNRYFDCQVPAIRAQGGEVLKFMGDGLLAIFPVEHAENRQVCARVLAAARAVEATVRDADWGGLEQPGGVHFGVALHVGDVLYGNVGSANRLDFTCIGPAVNLAARIEALSGQIGRTILTSADFASQCPKEIESGALTQLGSFALKGVTVPQLVYGVAS